jgi:hypothetical protein
MSSFPGLVYIDSPIRAAAKQMVPFFHQGVFDVKSTPLFMRKRIGNTYGIGQPGSFRGVDITMVGSEVAKRLPVRKGGAVFYGFNSQGNMHTVANRSYRHVLVLHGESNKRASARPAARLYDHVCLAGDMAMERYLRSGIFTEHDLDSGRLIKVGDTFIQDLHGYSVDAENGRGLLYAPTWEGYGGELNDYSSLDIGGLKMADAAARMCGLEYLVVRPHPYLGLLKPSLLRTFIHDLRELSNRRKIYIDLSDANVLTRSAINVLARLNPSIVIGLPVASMNLCVTDISAIESVCLKARLPCFVFLKNFGVKSSARIHEQVKPYYSVKAAGSLDELKEKLGDYIRKNQEIDEKQRSEMFTVSHPDFKSESGSARLQRLLQMTS